MWVSLWIFVSQAVWALGNIAGDSAVCRDYVLNCNILPPLLMWVLYLFSIYLKCDHSASCEINIICRRKKHFCWRKGLIVSLMIFLFPRLLTKSTRLTMTRNAVWALSNLCRGKSPPPDFEKVCTASLSYFTLLIHSICTIIFIMAKMALGTLGNVARTFYYNNTFWLLSHDSM